MKQEPHLHHSDPDQAVTKDAVNAFTEPYVHVFHVYKLLRHVGTSVG